MSDKVLIKVPPPFSGKKVAQRALLIAFNCGNSKVTETSNDESSSLEAIIWEQVEKIEDANDDASWDIVYGDIVCGQILKLEIKYKASQLLVDSKSLNVNDFNWAFRYSNAAALMDAAIKSLQNERDDYIKGLNAKIEMSKMKGCFVRVIVYIVIAYFILFTIVMINNAINNSGKRDGWQDAENAERVRKEKIIRETEKYFRERYP